MTRAAADLREVAPFGGFRGWTRPARGPTLLALAFYLFAYAVLPYSFSRSGFKNPVGCSCSMCLHGSVSHQCSCCKTGDHCTCRVSAKDDLTATVLLDAASMPRSLQFEVELVLSRNVISVPEAIADLALQVVKPPPRS